MSDSTETKFGDARQQFAALCALGYVEDLFTVSGCETFTRESVLIVLNAVKADPELFNELVLAAYDQIDREMV